MKHCTTDKCPQILDSSCVFYEGTSLIFSGINTNDSVETVIQKLNLKLESIPVFNSNNYYTKSETYSKIEIDSLLDVIEVTKTELDVLISENNLEPNRLYKITGVESWCFSQHLIKAIYLKAITNNTLESEGVGEFYTPKYNELDDNLGIWKGELFANEMIDSLSYNIGDKVIWGNLFWENISGEIGTNEKEYYDSLNDEYLYPKLNNYLSETNWQLITPNNDESLYNIQFCLIKYDLENDYINYREDDLGNKYELSYSNLLINFTNLNLIDIDSQFIYYVNSISLFLWDIDIVSYNNIYESVVLNCNNNHVFQNNIIENSGVYVNTLSNVNFINNKLYNSYFQANKFINVNFTKNNLNFSAIIGNILSEMDFDRNILNNSSVQSNNFLNVDFYRNKLDNSIISDNELKTFGGIFNNILGDSQISDNRYYIEISNNRLINNSQINSNNDSNIIINNKYTIIKDNILDNNCKINSNTFVEEGKEVDYNIKSIYGNELINKCSINNNTIKNGSTIFGHKLEYYSTINGNNLDTESNIYNNQLIQNGKIDNNILTGHGRIYGNQLDRASEITLCKLRISPISSYASGIHGNRLFTGKIQNVDFGNIVNPVDTNPNDPDFGGNALTGCIVENGSIIKDLTFPNIGNNYIQFVKMNGFSEFKNITINESIINVDFVNTIFNETSDYSKLIEGNGLQTNGFTKTYIDGVLLQDRFDEKQNNLGYTPENVGNKSDSYTASSSTTYASSKALVDGLATKQNNLTNPITGTGTSNYIPKFSATGTIGDSIIYEISNKIGINSTPSDTLDIKTVGQGSIRLGGANGRTISAYNSTGTLMNIDFASGATFLGNLYGGDIYDFATNKQSVRLSSTNITFWTNSVQRLTLDIEGNLSDSAGKFKSQRTITITGNTTLSEIHNGAVLNVTNTCNITIPTGLDANFQCVIFAKGSIIVTFVNGGVTVYAPSGLLLKTDKMASLISTSANNFNLTGELATS